MSFVLYGAQVPRQKKTEIQTQNTTAEMGLLRNFSYLKDRLSAGYRLSTGRIMTEKST